MKNTDSVTMLIQWEAKIMRQASWCGKRCNDCKTDSVIKKANLLQLQSYTLCMYRQSSMQVCTQIQSLSVRFRLHDFL